MLNKPTPKPQPTAVSPQDALDAIFANRVPKDALVPHEERSRTYEDAKKSLYDICDTIRDAAKNKGFQYIIKPKWLEDREKK